LLKARSGTKKTTLKIKDRYISDKGWQLYFHYKFCLLGPMVNYLKQNTNLFHARKKEEKEAIKSFQTSYSLSFLFLAHTRLDLTPKACLSPVAAESRWWKGRRRPITAPPVSWERLQPVRR
jgi:hypothetical protein